MQSFYFDTSAKIILVFAKEVNRVNDIEEMFKFFRKNGMINVLWILKNDSGSLEKLTMEVLTIDNPFKHSWQKINVKFISTENPKFVDVYPNRLKNLQGYSFKLLLTNQIPYYWMHKNRLVGSDSQIIFEIMNRHNATFHIEIYRRASTGFTSVDKIMRTDFSLNTGVVAWYGELLIPIATLENDGYCFLVPIFPFNSLLLDLFVPFDVYTWVLMFLALFIGCFIWNFIYIKKLSRSNVSTSQFGFGVYALFVGQSIPMHKLCLLQTCLLQLFVLLTFLLGNIYNSKLISSMNDLNKAISINSLDELRTSDIKIRSDPLFLSMIKESKFDESFIARVRPDLIISYDLQDKHDEGVALCMQCSSGAFLMEFHNNSKIYKILPEKFFTTPKTYLMSKISPFNELLTFYVTALFESGIKQYWKLIYKDKNLKFYNTDTLIQNDFSPLQMKDIKYLFVIWGIGIIFALFVFICEKFGSIFKNLKISNWRNIFK